MIDNYGRVMNVSTLIATAFKRLTRASQGCEVKWNVVRVNEPSIARLAERQEVTQSLSFKDE